ncbi:MAG: type 2 isopentenyl-diphosphate Delta-isomerase [Candidatus Micrarchaeota archaeon]
MNSKTQSRKKDHIDVVLGKDVQYSSSAGFDSVRFLHNALPELDLAKVDLSCEFLGKSMKFPLIIEAMTGGYPEAGGINRALAKAAQEAGVAMGLGSQRAMLENPGLTETFQIRKVAPDIPLIANIGAVQLNHYPVPEIGKLVSSVDADALAVHLNALQEIIQPEGDHDFSGALDAISKLCDKIDVPVIVKETGAGISRDVAEKLRDAGVAWIDVAGSGGTSWSKVEYMRRGTIPGFEEWGIPTVESIRMCRGILPLIASGGLRSGVDAAKAIALGADMAGAAFPFLKAYKENNLAEELSLWGKQMKVAAFLTGSSNYNELGNAKLLTS